MSPVLSKTLLFLLLVSPCACDTFYGRQNGLRTRVLSVPTYLQSNHSEIALLVVRQTLKVTVSNLCGGILVSKRIVITAAHCLYDPEGLYKKYPNMFRVEKGKDGVYTNVGRRQGIGWVAELIVPHPNYTPNGRMHDIGAIQLRAGIDDKSVLITKPTLPLTYGWTEGARFEILDDDERRVVSKRFPVKLVNTFRCNNIYRRWGMHIGRRQLCIEVVKHIFYHSGESAILLLNAQPIGILSFKFDVSSRALSFPLVFTELSRYPEFIQMQIKNESSIRREPYRICTSILYVVLSIGVIK